MEEATPQNATGEAHARLERLLALSSDIYWEQDAEYRFSHFSGSDAALVAGIRSRVLGRLRWEHDYFNLSPADWAAHRALLGERRSFRDLELGRVDESGRVKWISVSGEPVFDAAGRFAGYRGIGKDITAQKREQTLVALEHSIARALASADSSSAGLKAAIRAICELEDWPIGRFYAPDATGRQLRFAEGWAGAEPDAQKALEVSRSITYGPGEGLTGVAGVTRDPLWVSDVAKDPRATRRAGLWDGSQATRRGALIIPVDAGKRTIGVLS